MLELASVIVLGILAQWVSWRLKIPAILPLILTGLAVGPFSTFWTPDAELFIQPRAEYGEGGVVKGLFAGQNLFYFVSLSIGLILFEGGLTLRQREIRGIGPAIVKLITVGTVITFAGCGLLAHYIMGLNWHISFVFASLVVVTGPTVIGPILQNVPLSRNVSTILKWEGILIDPIGALLAVLMFEFVFASFGSEVGTDHVMNEFGLEALVIFLKIVGVGLAMGFAAAYGLFTLIKRELIPHYLLNVFVLALVLMVFTVSDELVHESGLLSVVVMGMVLGNLDVPRFQEIANFKESITVLLISILFILLAANITMDQLLLLVDWRCGLLFIGILAIRPIAVLASTMGSELSLSEKLYVGWLGPRGIVAAGIASVFGLRLEEIGFPGAEYIVPLVFMVVLGTVLLNATTAKIFAKWSGVMLDESNGILIVGASPLARLIAKYLQSNNQHVVLVDSSLSNIDAARQEGLEATVANIYNDKLEERLELSDIGYLYAMTASSEVNNFAVRRYTKLFGENGAYRLIDSSELNLDPAALPETGIITYNDDYLNLSEAVRDYPEVHELDIENADELRLALHELERTERSAAIFFKSHDGLIKLLPGDLEDLQVSEGSKLVYLGKAIALVETNA
ncbi:MAG: cation:proton antiporter [Saprospiraceae bacterium]